MQETSTETNPPAKEQPVLAICYDFDKTLSPENMQEHGYIESVGYEPGEFWTESNKLAEDHEMDSNLAYMYLMVDKAKGKFSVTRESLRAYGAQVALFPGVENWFQRIVDFGRKQGVRVEHYIISSGLKEMIEGTSIAQEFTKIYASSFYFDPQTGEVKWPAQAVNYTNKTQFLFRISKGVPGVNDQGVNDAFAPSELRVPFRNMVYIGDSDTDIPCMKLVNSYGGHSIGVYNPDTGKKDKVYQMIRDNRIRYYAPADYRPERPLDLLVKNIIEQTAVHEKLEQAGNRCKREQKQAQYLASEESRHKQDLILALEASGSFARTHEVIAELKSCQHWTSEEQEDLCRIALENSQVTFVLKDPDVKSFYVTLLKEQKEASRSAQQVLKKIKSH